MYLQQRQKRENISQIFLDYSNLLILFDYSLNAPSVGLPTYCLLPDCKQHHASLMAKGGHKKRWQEEKKKSHHEVLPPDAEQVEEVPEGERGDSLESEVGAGVRRGGGGSALGEGDRLHGHEVLHEEVPRVHLGENADAVLDAQLDGLHQRVHVDLEEKKGREREREKQRSSLTPTLHGLTFL